MFFYLDFLTDCSIGSKEFPVLTRQQALHFDVSTLQTVIKLHESVKAFQPIAENMKNTLYLVGRLQESTVKEEPETDVVESQLSFPEEVLMESKDIVRRLEHILHLVQEAARRLQSDIQF